MRIGRVVARCASRFALWLATARANAIAPICALPYRDVCFACAAVVGRYCRASFGSSQAQVKTPRVSGVSSEQFCGFFQGAYLTAEPL
jgi:hypothetical protein